MSRRNFLFAGSDAGAHRTCSAARLRTDKESVRVSVGGGAALQSKIPLSEHIAQFIQDAADQVGARAPGVKSFGSAVTLIRAHAPIPASRQPPDSSSIQTQ